MHLDPGVDCALDSLGHRDLPLPATQRVRLEGTIEGQAQLSCAGVVSIGMRRVVTGLAMVAAVQERGAV